MPKPAAIFGCQSTPLEEEGALGQDEWWGSRGSGSGGAGGCLSLAQEEGSVHHHFQEGFVAAEARGK